MGSFRTCFIEYQIMLVCEFLALFCRNFSLKLQIRLIANKQDDHLGISIVSHVIEPSHQVVECLPPRNIIAQKCTNAAPVITTSDGPEALLPCGVPDLNFYISSIIELNSL